DRRNGRCCGHGATRMNATTDLKPGLQMALLYLHDDQRSKAVYRYMMAHSTARHSQNDIYDLELRGFAKWHGMTYLTQLGRWAAVDVAKTLARTFLIPLPSDIPRPRRRTLFNSGSMSGAGNA